MTRLLREFVAPPHQTDARAVALEVARELWEWRRADPEQGCPDGGLWHGSSGPCRPRVQATSKGVTVLLQTAEAYAVDVAWHSFFAPRGYRDTPLDVLPGEKRPRPDGCPANPINEYEAPVSFTWARLARMHLDDLAGVAPVVDVVQLDLFSDVRETGMSRVDALAQKEKPDA